MTAASGAPRLAAIPGPVLGLVLCVGFLLASGLAELVLLLVGSAVLPGIQLDSNGLWGNNLGVAAWCGMMGLGAYGIGGAVVYRTYRVPSGSPAMWTAAAGAVCGLLWGTLDAGIAAVFLRQALLCGDSAC